MSIKTATAIATLILSCYGTGLAWAAENPPSNAKSEPVQEEPNRQADSANDARTVKSWTVKNVDLPGKQFLDSLEWRDCQIGEYTLRTGKIFQRWIAAMQFVKNGKVVLTEYTPPSEYLGFVDLDNGTDCSQVIARDVNHDGSLEVAFVHKKLDDPNYHMYAVYSLTSDGPKLLWKSGGELGDWLTKMHKGESDERWHGGASDGNRQ